MFYASVPCEWIVTAQKSRTKPFPAYFPEPDPFSTSEQKSSLFTSVQYFPYEDHQWSYQKQKFSAEGSSSEEEWPALL